jgi:hypothetical protein
VNGGLRSSDYEIESCALFSGVNAPTSQSLLNYVLLALVYGGILIYRRQHLTVCLPAAFCPEKKCLDAILAIF